ncbi:unnamed protein product, partial [Meganyctiphanes norvegica]
MKGDEWRKMDTMKDIVFTRTNGLLRSGALKASDKPIWYDVYEAFPPNIEPRYDRPAPEVNIRKVLYPEDKTRALFYKKYGSPGLIHLNEKYQRETLCQKFVTEYEKLHSTGTIEESLLMQETELALENQGIYLDRSRAPPKSEASPAEEESQLENVEEPKKSESLSDAFRVAELFKKE